MPSKQKTPKPRKDHMNEGMQTSLTASKENYFIRATGHEDQEVSFYPDDDLIQNNTRLLVNRKKVSTQRLDLDKSPKPSRNLHQ